MTKLFLPDSERALASERVTQLDRSRRLLAIMVLLAATTLGGNGSDLFDLLTETLAILLLFTVLGANRTVSKSTAPVMKMLMLMMCAVPIIQIVPIPVDVWHTLPGRNIAYAIQAQTGALEGYHAISLAPSLTRQAALRMLPMIAIFLATLRANPHERRVLILIAVAIILCSAFLGAVQFSTGELYLYSTSHQGSSVGVFVNRNHQADFLLAGILLIAGLGRERAFSNVALALFLALILLLAMCVVTTTSRMGTALMPPVTLAGLAILFGRQDHWRWFLVGLAVLLGIAVTLLLSDNSVVEHTIGRFAGADEDARYGFWSDTIFALRQYWPVGSGIGTFVPIYATVENLDNVSAAYVNHAHNDYVEVIMEAGLAAMLLIAAYIGTALVYASRIVRAEDWSMRAAGFGIILIMLVHSVVDYPLRTLALSTLFGLGNAMLVGCFSSPYLQHAALRNLPSTVDLEPQLRH